MGSSGCDGLQRADDSPLDIRAVRTLNAASVGGLSRWRPALNAAGLGSLRISASIPVADDATSGYIRSVNDSGDPCSWWDHMLEIALWTAAGLAALLLAFRLMLMWLFPKRPRQRR